MRSGSRALRAGFEVIHIARAVWLRGGRAMWPRGAGRCGFEKGVASRRKRSDGALRGGSIMPSPLVELIGHWVQDGSRGPRGGMGGPGRGVDRGGDPWGVRVLMD